MKIRALSLFDGISVGMLALKRAGFEVEKYYASEIKAKAMKCSCLLYTSSVREQEQESQSLR